MFILESTCNKSFVEVLKLLVLILGVQKLFSLQLPSYESFKFLIVVVNAIIYTFFNIVSYSFDFPHILQIQLKRFEYDFMWDTMVKVSSPID